jgi:hypothetical protein
MLTSSCIRRLDCYDLEDILRSTLPRSHPIMNPWKSFLQRYWLIIAVGIAIIGLSLFLGSSGDKTQLKGSTYSLEPSGYGAWYQKMVDRGVPIERWRKEPNKIGATYPTGTTMLYAAPGADVHWDGEIEKWVKAGNTLIVLGYKAAAQEIAFSQDLNSPQGKVRIETTRRWDPAKEIDSESTETNPKKLPWQGEMEPIVRDDRGMVVWQTTVGQGRVILATTPYLAANAYQNVGANLELLTTLATEGRQRIVVDEYSHGYQDLNPAMAKATAVQKDPFGYLARTPWLVVGVNLLLLTGILVWQQNRRFGAAVIPQPPQVENSTAYIQALGGILRQARRSDFVRQHIGKQEQRHLQQKLGLGNAQLLDRQTVLNALAAQPHLSIQDLPDDLQLASGNSMTEAQLNQWLKKLQALRAKIDAPSS